MSLVRDAWLSDTLQRPCYRLAASSLPLDLEARHLLKTPGVFVYSKVDPTALESIEQLEDLGFHLVDTNVTFESPMGVKPIPTECVRRAEQADEGAVVRLAGSAFRFSRFHLDPRFSTDDANAVKASWTANYFRGARGIDLLVAQRGSEIAGYVLLIDGGNDTLTIDLIAVDNNFQGQGVGKSLIAAVQSGYPEFQRLTVGTQLANYPSIKLYLRTGFAFKSAQHLFHFHSAR